jgi:hypothetical protein
VPVLEIIGFKKVSVMTDLVGGDYDLFSLNYPTQTTKDVIELIKKNHEKVLGIFVGHNHFDGAVVYHEKVVQYVCSPTYLDYFHEIIIEKV